MIERLKNCPNCAGFLDDFGRCEFCGSKVYDFCDIDVTNRGNRDRAYIRIKTDKQVILAPVITNTVNITCGRDSFPTMDIEFIVCGDMTMQEVQEV